MRKVVSFLGDLSQVWSYPRAFNLANLPEATSSALLDDKDGQWFDS